MQFSVMLIKRTTLKTIRKTEVFIKYQLTCAYFVPFKNLNRTNYKMM